MRGYVSSSNWGSAGVSSENLKLYSHKIFLYAFYVRKYFYSKKKANYGSWSKSSNANRRKLSNHT